MTAVANQGASVLAAAVASALLGAAPTAAADPAVASGGDPLALDEVIVTATRMQTPAFEVPALTYRLEPVTVQQLYQSRTLPEALGEVPGVITQKTGNGQGSPFMRGYTGFRNVLLIDGIRLNNSVFREGPNQYWNTVDIYSASRVEVVKGSASVQYGSDAIGGTVNVLSDIALTGQAGLSPRVLYRYSDAENSNTARAEATYRGGELRARAGLTYKDYGDAEGGQDVGTQPHTGYLDRNADARVEYDLDADTMLIAGYQYVAQDDAWRTHRTIYGIGWQGTTVGTDRELSFDQGRQLGYVQARRRNPGSMADEMRVSLSYQRQTEDQHRVPANLRNQDSGFEVGTTGLWAQFEKRSGPATIVYGADYYHDNVDSYRTDYNASGTVAAVRIQGPVADDATYDLAGAFAEATVTLSPRVTALIGGRYTYAALDAKKVEDPVTGQQISMSHHWDNFSASGRVIFTPREDGPLMLYAGISQAFRAPNLSDLTRLDTARSGELETPVPSLDPETFVSYEVGFKVSEQRWAGQLALFRTDGEDVIVRTPAGLAIGALQSVSKTNAAHSFVKGVEGQVSVNLTGSWLAWADGFWIDGKADAYPTSQPIKVYEPLDLLMPPTMRVGVRWTRPDNRLRLEAVVLHTEAQDKLSTRDIQDTQRVPPGGTPGYTVLSLRSEWHVTPALTLSAAVDNVGDVDYRTHGSGVNQPGRNVVMSLACSF